MKTTMKHPAAANASQADRDGTSKAAAQATVKSCYTTSRFIARGATAFSVLFAFAMVTAVNATNRFPWGWCTYGAAAEFDKYAPAPGCDWSGNAGNWAYNAWVKNWVVRSEVRAAEEHAIIVWTSSSMGHVGVVSRVYSDRITVTEMNWGKQVPGKPVGWTDKAGVYTTRDLKFSDNLSTPSFKFAGFVLPRKTTSYTADSALNSQATLDMQALRTLNGNFGSIIPNSLAVNKNWDTNFELRSSQFRYWITTLTVYHATWKYDPRVRYTTYWEPLTKQWIGWSEVQ